jgi:hypothetical protein
MLVCDWQKQQYLSQVHFCSDWSHWEQRVITCGYLPLRPKPAFRSTRRSETGGGAL